MSIKKLIQITRVWITFNSNPSLNPTYSACYFLIHEQVFKDHPVLSVNWLYTGYKKRDRFNFKMFNIQPDVLSDFSNFKNISITQQITFIFA